MLHVYFDDEQVNDNYIYELSKEQTLFSDTFQLGCTPMKQYTIKIDKEGVTTAPSIVYIKNDNDTVIDTLLVDDIDTEDNTVNTYKLVDYMAKFEFNYDASEIIIQEGEEVPVSLLTLVQDICSNAGVTLATTSFTGSDKMISWYDSRITAREYIGYVAELNGGYACMDADGQLQLIPFNNTAVDTISVDDCENFKLGEHHTITRVVYDNEQGIKWEYGDETGDTYYVDINNVYITDTSDIEAIYNVLDGYEYWALSVDNCPVNTAKIGETVAFTLGTDTYKTIAQIDQNYAGDGWFGGYKLDVKSSTQAETIVRDSKTMIKSIETKVDRELGEVTTTVASVQEQQATIQENVSTIQQTTSSIQTQVSQTQTDLENNYATKNELSSSVSSLSTTIEQTAQDITLTISDVQDIISTQGQQITTLETYIRATSRGLEISRSSDEVTMVLSNTELGFFNKANTKLAWLDSADGLGASALSIGDANTASNRWRVFTRQSGSHLTFTRHS